jgi:hypothetical protein
MVLLLDYDINGLIGQDSTEQKLAQSQIQFLGMVVNDEYEVCVSPQFWSSPKLSVNVNVNVNLNLYVIFPDRR